MTVIEQLEDIHSTLQSLGASVQKSVQDILKLQKDASQPTRLDGPLDAVTINTITSLIAYPIEFKLKDTDAATAANYNLFFVADKPYSIVSIVEVHGTLGTDAGAVTLNLEKLTGTQAAGSGTTVLSTAFNLKGTINTPQYGLIKTTPGVAVLNRGDRLSAKLTGTPTSLKNVVMIVYLTPFSS